MAKIFVYGERLVGSALGFLSVDGGTEIKIPRKGNDVSAYEHPISAGRHDICLYTNAKASRALNSFTEAAGGGQAVVGCSFEHEVTLGEDDVLVLHIVEKVTKTYIEYKIIGEEEYRALKNNLMAFIVTTGDSETGEKSKWTTFLLCLFLGGLGIHKFYEGKKGMGILYLFTFGLCGIGVIVDLIKIASRAQ